MRRPFVMALLVAAARAAAAMAAQCYLPSGTADNDVQYKLTPCGGAGGGAFPAQCCEMAAADECRANGLCWDVLHNSFYRASCRNADWTGCASVCTHVLPYDERIEVKQCGLGNDWCCMERPDDETCCNDTARIFRLSTPTTTPTTSSSTTPEATDNTSNNNNNNQFYYMPNHPRRVVLLGAMIGSIAFICLCFGLLCCYQRRKAKRKAAAAPAGGASGLPTETQNDDDGVRADGSFAPPLEGYYAPAAGQARKEGGPRTVTEYYAPVAAVRPEATTQTKEEEKKAIKRKFWFGAKLPKIAETEVEMTPQTGGQQRAVKKAQVQPKKAEVEVKNGQGEPKKAQVEPEDAETEPKKAEVKANVPEATPDEHEA